MPKPQRKSSPQPKPCGCLPKGRCDICGADDILVFEVEAEEQETSLPAKLRARVPLVCAPSTMDSPLEGWFNSPTQAARKMKLSVEAVVENANRGGAPVWCKHTKRYFDFRHRGDWRTWLDLTAQRVQRGEGFYDSRGRYFPKHWMVEDRMPPPSTKTD